MVDAFRTRLEALDGRLHVVEGVDAARDAVLDLVGSDTVARWDDAVLAGLGADAPPDEAGVSLIVADVAVADTGAIGFAHGPGRGRGAGLLPDRQVAVLDAADLVQTMAEALRRWFDAGRAGRSSVVFAAGPSRTADIEQRMMLGVHGPRSLDVVLHH